MKLVKLIIFNRRVFNGIIQINQEIGLKTSKKTIQRFVAEGKSLHEFAEFLK